MINSTAEAIAALKDASLPEAEREKGIHFLRDHSSPEGIDALVATLDDDDFGVRWAASSALAVQGDAVLKPLLRMLLTAAGDPQIREVAGRVLHDNASPDVRAKTGNLQKAMKGSEADIATMMEASKLLHQLGS
jgi:HEAT repeat protein